MRSNSRGNFFIGTHKVWTGVGLPLFLQNTVMIGLGCVGLKSFHAAYKTDIIETTRPKIFNKYGPLKIFWYQFGRLLPLRQTCVLSFGVPAIISSWFVTVDMMNMYKNSNKSN